MVRHCSTGGAADRRHAPLAARVHQSDHGAGPCPFVDGRSARPPERRRGARRWPPPRRCRACRVLRLARRLRTEAGGQPRRSRASGTSSARRRASPPRERGEERVDDRAQVAVPAVPQVTAGQHGRVAVGGERGTGPRARSALAARLPPRVAELVAQRDLSAPEPQRRERRDRRERRRRCSTPGWRRRRRARATAPGAAGGARKGRRRPSQVTSDCAEPSRAGGHSETSGVPVVRHRAHGPDGIAAPA